MNTDDVNNLLVKINEWIYEDLNQKLVLNYL